MRRKYTREHLNFLREAYQTMLIPELTDAFNARFGLDCGRGQVRAAIHNNGITCGRKTGKTVGRYRIFTKEQALFIRENYLILSIEDLTAEFNRRFEEEFTPNQIRSFTRNHNVKSGRTGCFARGHEPWNAGTKGQGLTGANRGSFDKGNSPPNRKGLGYERYNQQYGYIMVKVAEEDPYTGFPTRFRPKHHLVWEETHGPIPEGKVVIFLDGDSMNCDPGNLGLVGRAELLRLNKHHYAEAPPELKATLLAMAKLEVKTFVRQKALKEDRTR